MTGRYADTFIEEALELLAGLESALLELEENPRDPELIGSIFRALHTLKGSGAMAGFDSVASFVHEVETVFELVREGRLDACDNLVGLTLAARDHIAWLIEKNPLPTDEDKAGDRIVSGLRELTPFEGLDGGSPIDLKDMVTDGKETIYKIYFKPDADIFFKGLNPLPVIDELKRLGECRVEACVEGIPPLEEIDPETCYLAWDIALTTTSGIDAVRDVFIFFEDDAELRIEPIVDDKVSSVVQSKDITVDAGREVAAEPATKKSRSDSSIRVRSEKLDTLVNLIGELVTVQARLSQIAANRNDSEILAVSEEVERLTWDLRDQVLNIRMLPIGTTFGKFKRLVRDLSGDLGKDVEIVTQGGETELDKTVIERLQDPLVHLIRNCIDHGIESPQDRLTASKPQRGTISLEASHSGASVHIEIRDDGIGLDTERIRMKAIEKGLLDPEVDLSEADLHNLIFSPGFSTASQVTSVSGRGVGLDVLRQSIDDLRGTIEVSSRQGEGTTFTLKLPLTLAIIDGLLVRVAEDLFVLPLSAVEECVELKREEREKSGERHLANVRGEIVPYIRLRERFHISGPTPDNELIVITGNDGHRVGLMVDDVVGTHQTVIKSLGKIYQNVSGLSGATILGDGEVALILDISALLKESEISERNAVSSLSVH